MHLALGGCIRLKRREQDGRASPLRGAARHEILITSSGLRRPGSGLGLLRAPARGGGTNDLGVAGSARRPALFTSPVRGAIGQRLEGARRGFKSVIANEPEPTVRAFSGHR